MKKIISIGIVLMLVLITFTATTNAKTTLTELKQKAMEKLEQLKENNGDPIWGFPILTMLFIYLLVIPIMILLAILTGEL